jgi:hypothetical protein
MQPAEKGFQGHEQQDSKQYSVGMMTGESVDTSIKSQKPAQ